MGDQVKVLGESYSLDDQEDSAAKTVSRLWVYMARYRIEVSEVPAGCWALIEGVEGSLVKTGTITGISGSEDVSIFKPLAFHTASVMKVSRSRTTSDRSAASPILVGGASPSARCFG